MFSKLRSLIFKFDPELAHDLAIRALKLNYISSTNLKKYSSLEKNYTRKKNIKSNWFSCRV